MVGILPWLVDARLLPLYTLSCGLPVAVLEAEQTQSAGGVSVGSRAVGLVGPGATCVDAAGLRRFPCWSRDAGMADSRYNAEVCILRTIRHRGLLITRRRIEARAGSHGGGTACC